MKEEAEIDSVSIYHSVSYSLYLSLLCHHAESDYTYGYKEMRSQIFEDFSAKKHKITSPRKCEIQK